MSAAGRRVVVAGGGPAGLMAAEVLATAGAAVTIIERMPSPGRKFLMAGRGGLNLTHAEDFERFLGRYGAADPRLAAAIAALPPQHLRAWCDGLGQPTFVGTSGRVFPQSFKTSPLLRAWLARLDHLGVRLLTRHRWVGWAADGGPAVVDAHGDAVHLPADATVLALGGASWPRLGSDGAWREAFGAAHLAVTPLKPANVGFCAAWSEHFRDRHAGAPLKRIALSFAGARAAGEAVITRSGIEGGAVYALSAPLRAAIEAGGQAIPTLDLRPDLDLASLAGRLGAAGGKQSLSNLLRKAAGLAAVAIGLLREAALARGQAIDRTDPAALAQAIKAVPVRLTGVRPLAEAISTAGGVDFAALDEAFMLRQRPGTFIAGEMLDWEAPTGGYLLQACFATGAAAGRGALAWLQRGGGG